VSLFQSTEGPDATSLIGLPLIRLIDMLLARRAQSQSKSRACGAPTEINVGAVAGRDLVTKINAAKAH
jgi:hypothetical protein